MVHFAVSDGLRLRGRHGRVDGRVRVPEALVRRELVEHLAELRTPKQKGARREASRVTGGLQRARGARTEQGPQQQLMSASSPTEPPMFWALRMRRRLMSSRPPEANASTSPRMMVAASETNIIAK